MQLSNVHVGKKKAESYQFKKIKETEKKISIYAGNIDTYKNSNTKNTITLHLQHI